MIKFINNNPTEPYTTFRTKYEEALLAGQEAIEAINIASYDIAKKEVNSRYVNLKIVDDCKFIFFTNYNSPKSQEFYGHSNISCTFYWNKINTQIRMKANIRKTKASYNQSYFRNRSPEKNALAISSNQSEVINSFKAVKNKYDLALQNDNLENCPSYWGGYSFIPFEVEFWEGHNFRLNRRKKYIKKENTWQHFILQP